METGLLGTKFGCREETAHVERTRRSANVGVRPERVRKGHREAKPTQERVSREQVRSKAQQRCADERRVRCATGREEEREENDAAERGRRSRGRIRGREGNETGAQSGRGVLPRTTTSRRTLAVGLRRTDVSHAWINHCDENYEEREREVTGARESGNETVLGNSRQRRWRRWVAHRRTLDDVRFSVDVRRVAVFR